MDYSAQPVVTIELPTTIWYSTGDEENFFRWLYSIKGYISCQGRGRVLYVTFSLHDLDRSGLQELVAIFTRYQIPDFKQLSVLERSAHGDWFRDPATCWHAEVFQSP